MTMLSMSMHPSDETLSRLADLSEVERMRSRAGRHAMRCERCRGEIAAIEALGDAARGMADTVVPAALLGRIDSARRRAANEAPTMATDGDERVPAEIITLPVARARMTRMRGAAIAAAAAIVVAVLAWPAWRERNLAAASPGRVTIYPRYPRAGSTIRIRFVPSPQWPGPDTLWAEGVVDLASVPGSGPRALATAITTTLVRERDGSYHGRAILPANALSGVIPVMTAPPGSYPAKRITEIVLLTSDSSSERPSLDAMESAVHHDRGWRTRVLLAQEFARWAPDHPMRWLVSSSQQHNGPFDWLNFFDTEERRFARLTTKMNAKAHPRAGELMGMAALAYRIEEPGAAAAWTERLVREYPDDPAALDMRVQEIHQMELRGAPRDSMAAMIPSLDSLYERGARQLTDMWTLASVVRNNADSATAHRWMVRLARAGRFIPTELRGPGPFADAEVRAAAETYARDVLSHQVLYNSAFDYDPRYDELARARAYSTLASAALARGDYRRVLALTDSARVTPCIWPGRGTRALALIALGDSAAAAPYLAVFVKGGLFLSPDSARRMIGSRVTPQRWQQIVDSVEAARQACQRSAR
jgi:hypothetical protein